jgi:hypothetical protein
MPGGGRCCEFPSAGRRIGLIFAELTQCDALQNTALIQPQMFHAAFSTIETGFEQCFFRPHCGRGTPMFSSY